VRKVEQIAELEAALGAAQIAAARCDEEVFF
jgi:hypothetical protein